MGGLLSYYSRWPLLICFAALLGLISAPVFRAADGPPGLTRVRLTTLDGLRGFLALAVVFHHAAIYHRYLQDGIWQYTPSHLLNVLGPDSVSLFFMITGFLFWGQMIRAGGRPLWKNLYVGRLYRIGPLYLFAATALLAAAAVHTHFALHEPAVKVCKEVVRWLSLGLLLGQGVNGWARADLVLAGVTWTLQWEWFFYLSLPLLAIFAGGRRLHVYFVAAALAGCALCLGFNAVPPRLQVMYPFTFLLGMLIASLEREGWLLRLPSWAGGTAVLVLVAAALTAGGRYEPLRGVVLLAAALYLIVGGCSVFGLLTTKAAVRLGDVSFGVYLLQGLVLALVFRHGWSRAIDARSPLGHWALSLLSAALLVVVAVVVHRWLEQPGIADGKRMAQRLSRPTRAEPGG